MPSQLPPTPEAYPRPQPFTLHASHGQVYASNIDRKLIDLGALAGGADGRWSYCLDGNGLRGEGLPSADAALRDLAERLTFLFLDGQFTANADLRDSSVSLEGAPRSRWTNWRRANGWRTPTSSDQVRLKSGKTPGQPSRSRSRCGMVAQWAALSNNP